MPVDEVDEAELIRREDDDWTSRDSRSEDPADGGTRMVVGATRQIGDYPTAANAWYGMRINSILGAQVEGGAGTKTPVARNFLALNLGSTIPPPGTLVVCVFVPHRWVFRYDG